MRYVIDIYLIAIFLISKLKYSKLTVNYIVAKQLAFTNNKQRQAKPRNLYTYILLPELSCLIYRRTSSGIPLIVRLYKTKAER